MKFHLWLSCLLTLFVTIGASKRALGSILKPSQQGASTKNSLIFTNQISPPQNMKIQVGDIILISLNCYICTVIENETNSRFSHSAIVIATKNNQIIVAQALGEVHELLLEDFLKQARKKSVWGVFRLKAGLSPLQKSDLWKSYVRDFRGLGFDNAYLWDNFDSQGRELLYCSEFVTKLLNSVIEVPLLPKKLDFTKNWNFWSQYYQGKVPQNQLGNSPGSLTSPELFESIYSGSN